MPGAVVAGGATGLFGTITGFVADNLVKTIAGAAAAGVAVAGVVVGRDRGRRRGHEPRDTAREAPVSATAADPTDPSAQGGAGTPSGGPGKPDKSKGPKSPTKPGLKPGDAVPEGTPADVGPTTPAVDEAKPSPPAQPEDPTDQPTEQPPKDPEPSDPPPPAPASITATAQGTGGLAWIVDVAVKGLKPGERGTITVTLDRPALGIHLDPRCDLISLGRLTCRLTGPGSVRLLVTPVPGAVSTLTSVLQPGNDRSSVVLG